MQQLCHADRICFFSDLIERHASTEANPVAEPPNNKAEHGNCGQDRPAEDMGKKQPENNHCQEEENVRYG